MPVLSLQLLGPCVVTVDGAPLAVDRAKAIALLAYLALEPGPQPRDLLATLLWPGYDQSYARGNLRRTLSVLHRATGEAWIAGDRYSVSLLRRNGLHVDVDDFLHLLDPQPDHPAGVLDLQRAVALYRDDFMAGFTLRDAPGWDDWQRAQTERLRERFLAALDRLAEQYEAASAWDTALDCARRRLALEPTHEPAQRRLMALLARSGDRAGALRQFEAAQLLLAEEFDAPPSQESLRLAEDIRLGQFAPALPAPAPVPGPLSPQPHSERAGNRAGMLLPVTLLCAGVDDGAEGDSDGNGEAMALRLEALLPAAEGAVEKAGGRLETPQGNTLLAVFGATGVHEDDPERAVTAGLEIAEAMRASGIGASIGVATGEAYVGPLNGSVPVAVTGAVVSRARRLQSSGGLGGLLVDRATWQRTRHAFLYDARPLAVGDTPAHRPQRPLPRPRKSRGIDGMEARLVGRDGELNRLTDALTATASGAGRFAALTGEAGIGKSRLLAALTASEAVAPFLWLEGRCTEMGSATAFDPFVDLLESYFSRRGGELSEAVRQEMVGLVAAGRLGEDEAQEMASLFSRLLAPALRQVQETAPPQGVGELDAQQMQYRAMGAVCRFVAALCERQPVVLALDDLHWADSLSLDLVGQLLETAASQRLLLLAVYRDDSTAALHRLEQSAQRLLGRRAEVLRLTPLSPEESGAFLASLLGADSLPGELVEAVAGKAQGNPFFTEEIVRELLESGALMPGGWGQNGQHWRALPVPATVQSVILSRIHRLAPAEQEMLLWAAVIGMRFETGLLVEAASLPSTWEESLWRLEEAGFVYLLRSLPQTVYAFRHALGQEAIYASLSEKRRKVMHRQVGEAIERLFPERVGERVADLAYHFDRADVDEKALSYRLQEGEQALAAYLNEEAVRAFQQVLRRLHGDDSTSPEHSEQYLTALIRMGKIQSSLGSYSEASAALREAIHIGERVRMSAREVVRLRWWLGEALFWLNDPSAYVANAAEGLRLLGDDGDCVEAALMLHQSAIGMLYRGEDDAAARQVAKLEGFLLDLPYCVELRPAYGLMGKHFALFAKEAERGAGWFSALEAAGRVHGDGKAVAESQSWRSILAICLGDYRAALGAIEDSLRSARQIRSRQYEAAALGMLQRVLLAGGDLSRLVSVAEADRNAAQEVDDTNRMRVAELLHAIGQIGAGSFSTPLAACRHLQTVAAHPPSYFQCEFHLRLGQLFAWLGETELAQSHLEEALALAPAHTAAQWRVITQYSPPFLPFILGAMQANGASPDRYAALCQGYRADNPQVESSALVQWTLQPVQPDAAHPALADGADGFGGEGWQWIDPFGDCAFAVAGGLTIHAANCRDLWHINWSAPRYVRPVVGDFTAETLCAPACPDRPAIGGLLLWQDEHNFLRLTRNAFGPGNVVLLGALDKKDVVIGLGHLPGDAIRLRLERRGEQVRALCSADGADWYSVGQAAFPANGPVLVGLHAIGNIDRCAFPGAYPQGSAIRFRGFGVG